MNKEKCLKCLWKTEPGKNKIVCLFPRCIFESKKLKKSRVKEG